MHIHTKVTTVLSSLTVDTVVTCDPCRFGRSDHLYKLKLRKGGEKFHEKYS